MRRKTKREDKNVAILAVLHVEKGGGESLVILEPIPTTGKKSVVFVTVFMILHKPQSPNSERSNLRFEA